MSKNHYTIFGSVQELDRYRTPEELDGPRVLRFDQCESHLNHKIKIFINLY